MSIDEEQGGTTVDIAERRNGTKQDRTVAAVDEREAASLQRPSHPSVHGLHHLQQCSLVEEASETTSGRIGFGHNNVGGDTCTGERRGQSGISQPGGSHRLSQRTTGAIEAHAGEV